MMIEPVGFSGIRYYTEALSRQLVANGMSLALVTSRHYERLPVPPPYRVYEVMGGGDRTQSRLQRGVDYMLRQLKVADVVRMERPDLIHMQSALVNTVDILLLRWLRYRGLPVVYTVHEPSRASLLYTARWRIAMNRVVDRQIYHSANQLIVHTWIDRTQLIERYGVPAERITRIEHGNHFLQLEGIDIPSRDDSRIRLGLPLNVPVGLFFGDRRYSKGLDLLIDALPRIIAEVPEFRLIIAGRAQAAYRDVDFEAMLQERGVRDHVILDDRYIPNEQVAIYFAACDLVILPYRNISQSGVVHLAFSFGRPVVAARVGGLAEVVEEGVTGLFIEQVEDREEVATKIIHAAQHRDWLAILGQRARQQAESRFGWDSIARTTLDLYAKVLRKHCA